MIVHVASSRSFIASCAFVVSVCRLMEAKSVLVSYADRKKVLKFNVNTKLTDMEFTTKEFMREFSFESNVNINMTFQRFDPEWDEYIDLEPGSMLNHKTSCLLL